MRKRSLPYRQVLIPLLVCASLPTLGEEAAQYRHGISYFGELAYPEDYPHFNWVNPDAPKGGRLVLSNLGTFDSFNPLIRKGRPASGMSYNGTQSLLYDRLLEPSGDEPAAMYARLAESVALAPDYRWVSFRIRRNARWHDGEPVTARDVKFAFDMIKQDGAPNLKVLYRDVTHAELLGEHEVRFHIKERAARNATTALRIGLIYALPEHYWAGREFNKTTLDPPLGSGPYRIKRFVGSRLLQYERVEDYWGHDLPVMKGRFNFDEIKYDYFKDLEVMREAQKSGLIDARIEGVAQHWVTAYDIAAVREGLLIKEIIDSRSPYGCNFAVVFNLRQKRFQDPRLREALWWAYDFGWLNRVLLQSFYTRTTSFFTNSSLSQSGLPSPAELALLEPFRDQIPPRVFTDVYRPPQSTGYGNARENLKRADELLTQAGWVVRDGVRVNAETGEPLQIHFMLFVYALERTMWPFIERLRRLGIQATARTLELSNYLYRLRMFDFDATVRSFPRTHVPGAELMSDFGSTAADTPFSGNSAGIKDPVVDALMRRIVSARNRIDLDAAGRALDRVLLWNFYMVPGYHPPGTRYVYWDKFGKPDQRPIYRSGFPDTWWFDPTKAKALEQRLSELTVMD